MYIMMNKYITRIRCLAAISDPPYLVRVYIITWIGFGCKAIRTYFIHACIHYIIRPDQKSNPGVPYTYMHVRTFIHVRKLPGPDQFWQQKVIRAGTKCISTCLVFMYFMHACRYPSGSIRNGFVPGYIR